MESTIYNGVPSWDYLGGGALDEVSAVADAIHRMAQQGPLAPHVRRVSMWLMRVPPSDHVAYSSLPISRIICGHYLDNSGQEVGDAAARSHAPMHGLRFTDAPPQAARLEALVVAGWGTLETIRTGNYANNLATMLTGMDTVALVTVLLGHAPVVGTNYVFLTADHHAANAQVTKAATDDVQWRAQIFDWREDDPATVEVEVCSSPTPPSIGEAAAVVLKRLRAQAAQPGAGAYRTESGQPATPSLSYGLLGEIRSRYGRRVGG